MDKEKIIKYYDMSGLTIALIGILYLSLFDLNQFWNKYIGISIMFLGICFIFDSLTISINQIKKITKKNEFEINKIQRFLNRL